jgi:hypothetical protein
VPGEEKTVAKKPMSYELMFFLAIAVAWAILALFFNIARKELPGQKSERAPVKSAEKKPVHASPAANRRRPGLSTSR